MPANVRNATMLTDAEKRGDFSQLTHPNGSLFFDAETRLVRAGPAA